MNHKPRLRWPTRYIYRPSHTAASLSRDTVRDMILNMERLTLTMMDTLCRGRSLSGSRSRGHHSASTGGLALSWYTSRLGMALTYYVLAGWTPPEAATATTSFDVRGVAWLSSPGFARLAIWLQEDERACRPFVCDIQGRKMALTFGADYVNM